MSATVTPPPTQSIKYAGSKLRLLPHILQLVAGLPVQRVLDGFSGSTRVSQALARSGYHTTAADRAAWSEVLATAYLLNTRPPEHYAPLIAHLNAVPGHEGWFSQHYGGVAEGGPKRPFQLKNTRKLDGIREEIDRLMLEPVERAVALTSLLLALDRVDSTLGHFAAYLAHWSPRSHHDLLLEVPLLPVNEPERHRVLRGDIFDVIAAGGTYDLAYLDPPYGSNNEKMPPSRVRYSAYYHLWTTVVLNDRPPVFGRANRREDSRDEAAASAFEDFRQGSDGRYLALVALEQLIQQTQARYLLLSYSSGGRATRQELHDLLVASGRLRQVLEIDYRRNVMAGMRWTHEWIGREDGHREYLFLLEKE